MTADSRSSIMPEADAARREFETWLALVQRRWWWRRMSEAGVLLAAVWLVMTAATLGWMAWVRFDPLVVEPLRSAYYLLLALLPLAFLLPVALRRLSRMAAARYIEARRPGLDALILSATELSEAARREGRSLVAGSLSALVLQRASAACDGVAAVSSLERPRLKRAGLGLAATLVLAMAAWFWGGAPLQHGLALLLAPTADPLTDSPYQLAVTPGDITLVAGDDQAIRALAEGFVPDQVELRLRPQDAPEWRSLVMAPGAETGRFEAMLLNLSASQEYFVRSGVLESARYRIEVLPQPQVERIDLRYEYPAASGRPPELVQDGGPVRAVRGSRVEIRVTPDLPVDAGELVVDGQRRIPLRAEAGELRASLDLHENGRYRVELPAGAAGLRTASAEYPIEVFEDRPPSLALEWPGRDLRVSRIEEVEIALRAEDDVALHDTELVLNINGGEERVVRFVADPASPTRLQASHLLALEDLDLAPGDLISYYARVSDRSGAQQRIETTDLYFMDVRPFEQRFRRAPSAGGGGGGQGGGQGDTELTAQQRSLVVALFKLQRDRDRLAPEVLEQRVSTLAEAQARIRERVDAIVRRLGTRSMVSSNDGYARVAEELPQASTAMVETEARLGVGEPEPALAPARQALLHLQRADAAFRDVQVAMSRNAGGGGGGEASQTELANLFRLEMDKFRNQYEDLQRGQWNAPQRQLDDALERLRELARRQQREIERAQMRGQRGGGAASQAQLAAEMESLMRELERLTRQRDPAQRQPADRASSEQASAEQALADRARRALQRLQSAREAMRAAGDQGGVQAGEAALQELQAARQELEQALRGGLARGIEQARQLGDASLDKQRRISAELREALQQDAADPARLGELAGRKRELAAEIQDLGQEIQRLQAQAAAEENPAHADLEAAGQALAEDFVVERMRDSARALVRDPEAQAASGEAALESDLERLRQRLARAAQTATQSAEAAPAQTLERLRAMIRSLRAEQRRLQAATRQASDPTASHGQDGRDGDNASAGSASAGGGAVAGGGASAAPQGPAGGYDRGYAIDPDSIRQQLRQRGRAITDLLQDLEAPGSVAGDIAALMDALGATEAADAQALLRSQDEWLARLQRLELALREPGDDAVAPGEQGLPARPVAEVAPDYRALIETYYRRLSEDSDGR